MFICFNEFDYGFFCLGSRRSDLPGKMQEARELIVGIEFYDTYFVLCKAANRKRAEYRRLDCVHEAREATLSFIELVKEEELSPEQLHRTRELIREGKKRKCYDYNMFLTGLCE